MRKTKTPNFSLNQFEIKKLSVRLLLGLIRCSLVSHINNGKTVRYNRAERRQKNEMDDKNNRASDDGGEMTESYASIVASEIEDEQHSWNEIR